MEVNSREYRYLVLRDLDIVDDNYELFTNAQYKTMLIRGLGVDLGFKFGADKEGPWSKELEEFVNAGYQGILYERINEKLDWSVEAKTYTVNELKKFRIIKYRLTDWYKILAIAAYRMENGKEYREWVEEYTDEDIRYAEKILKEKGFSWGE